MELIHILETALEYLVQFAIVIFEFIGVGIIIYSGIKGFIGYVSRSPKMKITLAQGLAIGLEFKLGSDFKDGYCKGLDRNCHRGRHYRIKSSLNLPDSLGN